MNEAQLKAVIRQGFSLQNTADKAVVNVDDVLARTMARVKGLVSTLPEEGLLRNKSWAQLEPLVRDEISKYTEKLGNSIQTALVDAEPGMERAAIREAQLAGADFGPETVRVNPPGGGVAKSVELALNSKVNNVTVQRLFNLDGKGSGAPIDKALFKTIDRRVRGGIIQGQTTDEIAKQMIRDVKKAGIPGVDLNSETAARQIRSQAMSMARTATQDMARQVKEEVYRNNADAMEGMEYEWTTALDSKTCQTCSPLDGQRWKLNEKKPDWPLHPNCRCQTVPVDPDDPFWNEPEKTGQVLRPVEKGPYKGEGAYKTPVTINGKKFYRKAVPFTSDTPPPRYSDLLAKWATSNNASLVEAMGPTRAAWFKKEYDRLNKDPQQILQAMLTGKTGAQQWIPIPELMKKTVKLKKAKPLVKKAAVKPKPKKAVAKPVPKAAPPKKAESVPKTAKTTKKVAPSDLSAQIAAKEAEFKKYNSQLLLSSDPKEIKAAAAKASAAKAELQQLQLKDPAYVAKKKAAEKALKKSLKETTEAVDLPPALAKAKPPIEALKRYTGQSYRDMRAEQFRQAKRAGKKLSAFEEAQVKIFKEDKGLANSANSIESFLKRGPKYKGEVYRTLVTDKEGLDDLLAGYKEGREMLAMESWTADSGLDFAEGKGQRVFLRTRNKKGVDISAVSEYEKEDEVLMPKGVRYRLTGVKKEEISPAATKEGLFNWTVDLEQI